MAINAIGYVRVSTEDQAKEGVSLEAQREKIRMYCELKGICLTEVIEDAGVSAKDLNRPGAKILLDKVANKDIDAVVVYKLDRIFRSTIDALETAKKFHHKGVALHSIQENLDTESAIGRFFFTLLSALGQMERELIGERTKMALKHLKDTGKVYGNIPYGMKSDVDGNLSVDKHEFHIINFATSLYEGFRSYRRTAEELNKYGYKTRSGGKWYAQQVKNILVNNQEKLGGNDGRG